MGVYVDDPLADEIIKQLVEGTAHIKDLTVSHEYGGFTTADMSIYLAHGIRRTEEEPIVTLETRPIRMGFDSMAWWDEAELLPELKEEKK